MKELFEKVCVFFLLLLMLSAIPLLIFSVRIECSGHSVVNGKTHEWNKSYEWSPFSGHRIKK